MQSLIVRSGFFNFVSMIKYLAVLLLLFNFTDVVSQKADYTRQDSLRGSITPQREWWDLLHYDLHVSVDIPKKSISGRNIITYKVLESSQLLQIDLQSPMRIDQVTQAGVELDIIHEGDAHFIKLKEPQSVGNTKTIEVVFSGQPREAENAPWDGGFVWTNDSNGKDFIANANQGIGASVWWPNKDHYYDEPDRGLKLSINVPRHLKAVGNGRLLEVKKEKNKTQTYVWEVKNPINNYGVNVNIADYVNFKDVYQGEKGPLDFDFWVLKENEKKAKEHFQDAYRTMEAFEHWFGPYPFYEDSYKLVEVPYLGMEHQSSVTYGNGYLKGYKGSDLSLTGWGLKWDYIIVHETGHEWFANSITHKDAADMWIHESFTFYSESIFIEYFYGKQAASDYLKGSRYSIQNQEPIIGDYEVNDRGADLYNKGANVLHTLRQVIDDDDLWKDLLRGLNKEFYHQIVETKDIESYLADRSGLDLDAFFDQYLRDPRIPVLEYIFSGTDIAFRWTNCIEEFDMPVKILLNDAPVTIHPTSTWSNYAVGHGVNKVNIDKEYYVYLNEVVVNRINE